MADKISIIKIEYDTDEAQKNLDDLALKIDGLNESNKYLKKTVNEARKDLKKTDAQLKEEGKTRENLINTIQKNTVKIARNADAIKQAKRQRSEAVKEITGEKSAFDKLTDSINENNKEIKNQSNFIKGMDGSIKGMSGSLKGMGNSIKSTNSFIKRMSGSLKGIGNSIKGTNSFIKGMSGSLNKMDGSIKGMSGSLNKMDGSIKGMSGSLNKMDGSIKGMSGSLNKMDGSINKVNKSIKGVDGSIRNMDGSIRNMDGSINEMSGSIKGMSGSIDGMDDSINDMNGSINEMGNKLDSLPGPIGGIVSGIGSMTKAALTFIATPFGAILAAIVGTVGLLIKAFKRSETNMNKIKQVTARLSGAFQGLLKMLEPVAEFIVDNLIKAFDALGTAVDKTLGFVSKSLKKLGFDKAAENVNNFTEKLKDSSKASEDLEKKQALLIKQQRNANRIQLEFQRLAEIQRQIRDDESKGIDERIDANKKLGSILKEQLNEELKIARLALEIAEDRIKLEGDNETNLNARAEALTRIADIQERITGQESEQLVNVNSLIKERDEFEKASLKARQENRQIDFDQLIENAEAELEMEIKKEEEEDIRRANRIAKAAEEKAAMLAIEEQAQEQLRVLHESQLQQQFNDLQRIIDATRGMANQRLNIISDTFAKIATINFKEVKTAKQAFMQIGSAARGLTDLIISGNQDELNDLEIKKETELKLVEGNVKAQEAIEARFNKKKVALLKAQAKEERKKATIDAVIATALAVLNGLQTKPFIPNGLISAGLAGVLGGVQIATIKKQQKPSFSSDKIFAKGGGIVNGDSHSQGGVNIYGDNGQLFGNVEDGEAMFVMKKDATAEIAAYSQLNESYGGRSFFKKPVKYAKEGGELDGTDIRNTVREELESITIVTKVSDIETGLTDMKNIKEIGMI